MNVAVISALGVWIVPNLVKSFFLTVSRPSSIKFPWVTCRQAELHYSSHRFYIRSGRFVVSLEIERIGRDGLNRATSRPSLTVPKKKQVGV